MECSHLASGNINVFVFCRRIHTQDATESVPMRFTIPAGTFADANGEPVLLRHPRGRRPLPPGCTSTPSPTFSGTPGGGDIAVLQVRVIADDLAASPLRRLHPARGERAHQTGRSQAGTRDQAGHGPGRPSRRPPSRPPTPAGRRPPRQRRHRRHLDGAQGRRLLPAPPTGPCRSPASTPHRTSSSRAPGGRHRPHRRRNARCRFDQPGRPHRADGFRVVVQPTQSKDEVDLVLLGRSAIWTSAVANQTDRPPTPSPAPAWTPASAHRRAHRRHAATQLAALRCPQGRVHRHRRARRRRGGQGEHAEPNFWRQVSTIFRIRVSDGQRVSFNGREASAPSSAHSPAPPGVTPYGAGLLEHARQARAQRSA